MAASLSHDFFVFSFPFLHKIRSKYFELSQINLFTLRLMCFCPTLNFLKLRVDKIIQEEITKATQLHVDYHLHVFFLEASVYLKCASSNLHLAVFSLSFRINRTAGKLPHFFKPV